jgi:uncharacterized membrane protein
VIGSLAFYCFALTTVIFPAQFYCLSAMLPSQNSQLYPFSFVLYDFGLALKSQLLGLILFSVVAHATSFTGTHSIWTQMLER